MFYRHYKGNDYYVLGVVKQGVIPEKAKGYLSATHTETGHVQPVFLYGNGFHANIDDSLILYIDTQGNYWLRPEEMFFEYVEVDGQSVRRFTPFNPRTMGGN
ncbi:DUF1653 domain-containing protein [Brevibacillus laterosporus]|uniref:DUF1653 domain-containing protein n=1 Tax=Brevibacillus laterosporus TaxID=1465 RepID=UPI003D1A9F85